MKQVSYTICALSDEMIHHDVFRAHACMTHRVHSIATCAYTQTHSNTLTQRLKNAGGMYILYRVLPTMVNNTKHFQN